MKTSSAKAKGRRLQQMVASVLLSKFQSLSEDDIRSTSMGAQGEDIQLSSKARELIPFSIECKNQERVNIWDAITQSNSNSKGNTPIVVIKKNNTQPHVVISLNAFVSLIGTDKNNTPSNNQQVIEYLQKIISDLQ